MSQIYTEFVCNYFVPTKLNKNKNHTNGCAGLETYAAEKWTLRELHRMQCFLLGRVVGQYKRHSHWECQLATTYPSRYATNKLVLEF